MCTKDAEIVKAESAGMVLHASSPAQLVAMGREVANVLADVIEQQHLYADIQGKKYVTVEGWTTLLAMLGVSPLVTSCEETEAGDYIAWAELRDRNDHVIGRGLGICGSDEDRWSGQPRFARASMASTRAISKAARSRFSFIVTMSGFQPTPAEEMDHVAEMRSAKKAANGVTVAGTVMFGKNKGTHVSKLTDAQLAWYIDRAERNAADESNQYRERESAWLDVLLAERDRREDV